MVKVSASRITKVCFVLILVIRSENVKTNDIEIEIDHILIGKEYNSIDNQQLHLHHFRLDGNSLIFVCSVK